MGFFPFGDEIEPEGQPEAKVDPSLIQREHYEECLERHKGGSEEVDWPTADGAVVRYQTILDLIDFCIRRGESDSLLDFGCGTGTMYPFFNQRFPGMSYTGVDVSKKMITTAIERYGNQKNPAFIDSHLLSKSLQFDYIICCGTFTLKLTTTQQEMREYLHDILKGLWERSMKGMAFNLMDSHKVDWERKDLFFLSYNDLADKVLIPLGIKDYVIRADYGLREYMVFCYK